MDKDKAVRPDKEDKPEKKPDKQPERQVIVAGFSLLEPAINGQPSKSHMKARPRKDHRVKEK